MGESSMVTALVSGGKSLQAGWECPIHLAVCCPEKQGPASCYSTVTNLCPGCGPIEAHDDLRVCIGGSQPGQRAGAL